MANVRKVHKDKFIGDPSKAIQSLSNPEKINLTLQQATYTIASAIGLQLNKESALSELENRGWLKKDTLDQIDNTESLSNGEAFMLIRDVVDYYVGIKY
ncbi:hypothetical protein D3C85_1678610 [compost metagenome]